MLGVPWTDCMCSAWAWRKSASSTKALVAKRSMSLRDSSTHWL
ncbi:hypothetical protein ACN28S_61360 [Cystobacter fuscus]